jgi:F-type H+-transporting ATPase subunit b
VEKASSEAQHTLDQARASIELEKQAALSQLRTQVADMALQAASALVDANLDDDKNRKLVDDVISSIPAAQN